MTVSDHDRRYLGLQEAPELRIGPPGLFYIPLRVPLVTGSETLYCISENLDGVIDILEIFDDPMFSYVFLCFPMLHHD